MEAKFQVSLAMIELWKYYKNNTCQREENMIKEAPIVIKSLGNISRCMLVNDCFQITYGLIPLSIDNTIEKRYRDAPTYSTH